MWWIKILSSVYNDTMLNLTKCPEDRTMLHVVNVGGKDVRWFVGGGVDWVWREEYKRLSIVCPVLSIILCRTLYLYWCIFGGRNFSLLVLRLLLTRHWTLSRLCRHVSRLIAPVRARAQYKMRKSWMMLISPVVAALFCFRCSGWAFLQLFLLSRHRYRWGVVIYFLVAWMPVYNIFDCMK